MQKRIIFLRRNTIVGEDIIASSRPNYFDTWEAIDRLERIKDFVGADRYEIIDMDDDIDNYVEEDNY